LAAGDFGAATLLTEGVIKEMETCSGPGVDEYMPKAWGLLGEVLFRAGDHDGARTATERALELCRRTGDQDGVATYTGNLAEIARVRGERLSTKPN
jgi:hypothetical protein